MNGDWEEVSREGLAQTISMALLLKVPKRARIKDDELRESAAKAIADYFALCGKRVFKREAVQPRTPPPFGSGKG